MSTTGILGKAYGHAVPTKQIPRCLQRPGAWIFFCPIWLLTLISLRVCLPHRIEHIVATLMLSLTATGLWFYGTTTTLFPSPFPLQTRPQRKPSSEPSPDNNGWPGLILPILALLVSGVVVILGGIQHDHLSYMSHWSIINDGNTPWSDTSNTYFPVHAFLAPLAGAHPLLVKALFASISFSTLLLSSLGRVVAGEHLSQAQKRILFGSIALCPYSIIVFYWLGLNDAMTGSLLLLATILATSSANKTKAQFLAGVLIALGAGIKMYPLLVAPFFLIRGKRIQWSFLGGCMGTLVILFSVSLHLWGISTFQPFRSAGSRGPAFLSPFNALSQLGVDLTRYSTISMLLALGICFLWYLKRNVDFPTAVIMGVGISLFFYRVGHVSYLAYVILSAPFMIRHWSSAFTPEATAQLSQALLGWVGFLNWFQLQCQLNCGMTLDTPSRIFRDHGAWLHGLTLVLVFSAFQQLLTAPGVKLPDRRGASASP